MCFTPRLSCLPVECLLLVKVINGVYYLLLQTIDLCIFVCTINDLKVYFSNIFVLEFSLCSFFEEVLFLRIISRITFFIFYN